MSYASAFVTHLRGVDRHVLDVVSAPMIAGLMVVAGLIALARRRPALAVRALVIIGLATVTTQLLKHYVLWREGLATYGTPNSLPSGHVTAAATAAVALTIVVPARWRGATAWIGAAWTALMGLSVVVNEWHRPSDVVAAVGVVSCYALLLSPVETSPHRREGSLLITRVAWAVFGLSAAAVGAAVFLVQRVVDESPRVVQVVSELAESGGVEAAACGWAGLVCVLAVSLAMMAAVDRLHRGTSVPAPPRGLLTRPR